MQRPRPLIKALVHNPVSALVGHWHAQKIKALEKHIGYSLRLRCIPEAWIQSYAAFNLTSSWQARGLNVTGVDYFTVGRVVGNRSTRFDSLAETFQSWIGGYLVRLNEDRIYTLQEHLNLAVVDQVNWLRHYGDPRPVCELTAAGFQCVDQTNISGYRGAVYVGGGYSHSDIGAAAQGGWARVAAGAVAVAFNGNGAQPRHKGANFMPHPTTEPYARLFLKGIIIIVEIRPNVHAVLYGNGVITHDPNGVERDTFEIIKERLIQSLASTRIAEA